MAMLACVMSSKRLPSIIIWRGMEIEELQGNARDHHILTTENQICSAALKLVEFRYIQAVG